MAGITLAQAEAKLNEYLAAESKVLAGQRVEIDGQSLTRANLEQIQAGVTLWDSRCKALASSSSNGGRGRAVTVRPWA